MTQSSIANGVLFSLVFISAPLCAVDASNKEVAKQSSEKQSVTKKTSVSAKASSDTQDERGSDVEKAVKQWEDTTAKLTKQLNSATGKMKGVIKDAKDSEGYTIQVGDISITVDKGNPYYLKMFIFTVLLKEILKQYDENPTVATKKMIEHGKRSFTGFARAVGLIKKPIVKKPWWQF